MTLFGVTLGKNDIAFYTIIGSAAYNMLIIASICCFCVYSFKITLNKRILLQHSLMYALNLLVLIGILYKNHNSRLYWYDSLVSIALYVIFSLLAVYDKELVELFERLFPGCKTNPEPPSSVIAEVEPSLDSRKQSCVSRHVSFASTTLVAQNLIEKTDMMLINKYKLVDLIVADSTNNFSTYQIDIYVNDSYNEPYDFMQSYKEIKPLNLSKKFKLITVLPARIFAYLMIVDFRRFQSRKNLFFPVTLITSFIILIGCSFVLIWFA